MVQSPKTESPASVRPVKPADEARWHEMHAALAATGPEPCGADASGFVWKQVMAPGNPMGLLMAADKADRPTGFLLYVTHPYSMSRRPVSYLLDLYVEPAFRRCGIGTALIRRLTEIGREAGWLRIYWMTQADNAQAHALYSKLAQRSSLVRYDLYLNSY